MPPPRVTIGQLARQLGLSKFSVSRALSGKDGVSDDTRARVQRAATRLGYGAARPTAPRSQILFIMQEQDPASSELWINVLHAAEREAALRGFAIVPRQSRQFAATAELDPAICGLILAVNRPELLVERALRTGLPTVCCGYGPPLGQMDCVVGADWEGGVVVARHLTGLGHRHIGFVCGEPGLAGRSERWRGLCDGAGTTGDTDLREISFPEPNGFPAAFTAHVRAGYAPTALFCAHDGIAITVISELFRLGIRVPDDISVVGFNDFVCATQIAPQLTTVRMPQEALGALLIRCMAMRLGPCDDVAMPPLRFVLTPEFIERQSTAKSTAPRWMARLGDALSEVPTPA